jgi:tetratricopeptide (TPR) repeat protein
MSKPFSYPLILIAALLFGSQETALASCGTLASTSSTGRHDYRDPKARARFLNMVESHHFRPEIESLTDSRAVRFVARDISYTLNVFPNHHRALDTMSRLSIKVGSEQPDGSNHDVICWFQRAAAWRPDDGMVRMVLGVHLQRIGKTADAIKHTEAALRLEPGNARIQYQLGLLYLSAGDLDNAERYGHEAYAGGYTNGELIDALKKKGRWNPSNASQQPSDAATTPQP